MTYAFTEDFYKCINFSNLKVIFLQTQADLEKARISKADALERSRLSRVTNKNETA